MDRSFGASLSAGRRLSRIVPGGAHTYAKGPDQYPGDCAPVIARGSGSHVWDVDGNQYIEYGSGLRSVILGHGHPEIVAAVSAAAAAGTNFTRPSMTELEAAEDFIRAVPTMEMVKFAKNGSDVTTAALRLARAVTGRNMVGVCLDQPFFSTDDWFIGMTPMSAGIPSAISSLTDGFHYGDLADLAAMFDRHPGEIAAIFLEVESGGLTPPPGYLAGVVQLAHERGALVVFDEMITGFRWALGGAHSLQGVVPDLCTFGKAIGNGFAVSALAGRRDVMERGGLNTEADRVFLLSTTHGAESTGLAALRATIAVHRRDAVSDRLMVTGSRLRGQIESVVADAGLGEHVRVSGRACNLVFATLDAAGQPSQAFRTLLLRGLIRHGVLAPSLVVSVAHTDADIEATAGAFKAVLPSYARALDNGDATPLLGGPSVKPVFRSRA